MAPEAYQQYLINAKMTYSVDDLTKNMPFQLPQLFRYVRSLKIYEKPDYSYMRKIFSKYISQRCFELKISASQRCFLYDWVS